MQLMIDFWEVEEWMGVSNSHFCNGMWSLSWPTCTHSSTCAPCATICYRRVPRAADTMHGCSHSHSGRPQAAGSMQGSASSPQAVCAMSHRRRQDYRVGLFHLLHRSALAWCEMCCSMLPSVQACYQCLGALRGSACCRGFDLPAKWVVHTVGPIYSQYSKPEAASLLADAHK